MQLGYWINVCSLQILCDHVNELRLENDELRTELLAAEESRRLMLLEKNVFEQSVATYKRDIEHLQQQVKFKLLVNAYLIFLLHLGVGQGIQFNRNVTREIICSTE